MNQISKSTCTLVTLSYWAFMLSDGALRMVILFRFHELGYSAVQLSFLFLLYEFAGIVTNLLGGWVGARFGLKRTLFLGLFFQVIALIALSFSSVEWAPLYSVLFVMAVQGLAGIAKDLTKMSSKSSVKLLVSPSDGRGESRLFFWVALLTGVKNALKGVGFFLGVFLFTVMSYQNALLLLAGMLIAVLLVCLIFVQSEFGKMKSVPSLPQLLSKTTAINRLSFARVFLFASRDVWFVVGLPVFLHTQLGWSFPQAGGFMACWVIGYGFVQALAPKIARTNRGLGSVVVAARLWGFLLVAICMLISVGLMLGIDAKLVLIIGLALFGFIFAVNSSIHSYLILAYSSADDVSLNVGFYYMANAVGRLAGTLLSGLVYLWAGFVACLWVAALLCLISAVTSLRFPESK